MVRRRIQSEHPFEELSRPSHSGVASIASNACIVLERGAEDTALPCHLSRLEKSESGAALDVRREIIELRCPLELRLTGAKSGKLDLQLQLLEFKFGTHCTSQNAAQLPLTGAWQGGGDLLGTAGSLAFLRLTFPEHAPAVQRWLTRLGTAQAAGLLVSLATQKRGRSSIGTGSLQQAVIHRLPFLSAHHRSKRRIAVGLQGRAHACGEKISELASSAALMAATAFLWRQVHPTSHQLLQAIIVAVELSSGYAETKRKAASGAIRTGPQLEAAWRARHKWAARKAGKVLTDSYPSPPLRPFLTAAQKLSIGLLLLVSSPTGVQQALTPSQQNTGVAAGWGAPGPDSSWILSLSYPLRHSKAFQEEGSRSAGELAAQAPIDAGSAGQNTPALQSTPSPPKSISPPPERQLVPQDAAEGERPAYFQPSPAEDLRTGCLPTMCSLDDIKKYTATVAAEASAQPVASPFADSRATPEDSAKPGEIKEFSTEELVRMDPGISRPGGHNQRDELVEGSNLALYGRGDHLTEQSLTLLDRQKMAFRGLFLMAVFLPFLVLGPLFIILSSRKGTVKKPAEVSPPPPQADTLIGESLNGGAEEASAPYPSSRLRLAAYHLLLWGIRCGGAAFIKWGQWSATREDMFPPELCRVLAELHDQAPTHSWAESKREIEAAFGRSVEELFESIDHDPLASGSIAQVHRAIMTVAGQRRSVVVKVRHPGVDIRIRQDFQLLKPLAAAASRFRALKGLSLKESLAQFSSTMTAQTDLRVEAAHLRRFFRNFAAVRGSVTPPFPLPDYISDSVLIETFEPGQSVSKYIRNPAPFNTQVVALGVDTYLKMLLTDNFVHTDLHPGNILVRRRDGGDLSTEVAAESVRGQLQLILLDFGLAEELTPVVRHHFISFLHMIAAGDGRKAAGHMLKWSSNQSCPDPAGFTAAMRDLFNIEAQIDAPDGIELDKVLKSVLRVARQFEVSIDSSYAALVIGVVVLVGFATSMDPAVNLMDAAAPAFLQSNLLGQVSGRLYT